MPIRLLYIDLFCGAGGTSTGVDRARLGVARVDFLSKQFGGRPEGKNIPVDGPAGTVETVDHHAFVSAYYGNSYSYSGGGQVASVAEPCGTLLTNPKQNIVTAHYLMNPQYRSAGGSVNAPCFTLIARMDKRPPYLVSVEQGVPAWRITEEDTPAMKRVKEFCILYGIVDITMRMLRIPEMKLIQGFGVDYVLHGTQEEQKKFLGNAVETGMAKALCEATAEAIDKYENSRRTA